MRITKGMVMDNYLKNLNRNMSTMVGIQNQVSSGKRLNKLSDDPVDAVSVMQYRVKLYKSQQYQENVERGLTSLEQTESSVMELNGVIKSAYETVIQMANDYLSPEDKAATAALIGQLRDHVVTIANTKSGDSYIFGGYNSHKAPFTVDNSGKLLYNGLDITDTANPLLIAENDVSVDNEMGFNLRMSVSVNGTQLLGMGEDNIYTLLDNLYNALNSNATAGELSAYTDKLQAEQSRVLTVLADIGGRVNRLELIANRYEEDTLMYTNMKSRLEDVDQAEAIMNFKMSEYVYSAALQIGSKIIQPSLVDFLK